MKTEDKVQIVATLAVAATTIAVVLYTHKFERDLARETAKMHEYNAKFNDVFNINRKTV